MSDEKKRGGQKNSEQVYFAANVVFFQGALREHISRWNSVCFVYKTRSASGNVCPLSPTPMPISGQPHPQLWPAGIEVTWTTKMCEKDRSAGGQTNRQPEQVERQVLERIMEAAINQ